MSDVDNFTAEVYELIDRCKLGNDKLWLAWRQTCEQKDQDVFNKLAAQWTEASGRLNALCYQLQVCGYKDCLYISTRDGRKQRRCLQADWCWVCPSEKQYYLEEFDGLGREEPKLDTNQVPVVAKAMGKDSPVPTLGTTMRMGI